MSARLSGDDFRIFQEAADLLLPGTAVLPPARETHVATMLDTVLGWRPDLVPDLLLALRFLRTAPQNGALVSLEQAEPAAYMAFRTLVLAAYMLDPAVGDVLGYRDTPNRLVTPEEQQSDRTAELLVPVLGRGPVWRAAPQSHSAKVKHMARHIFLAFTNAVAGRDDEFNEWQDTVHLPEGLSQSEYKSVRRFKLADTQFQPGEQKHGYLNVWEIESDDIAGTIAETVKRNQASSAGYSEALDASNMFTAIYSEQEKG
jgi:hypothetical protein